jgi:lysyl endopeptidase
MNVAICRTSKALWVLTLLALLLPALGWAQGAPSLSGAHHDGPKQVEEVLAAQLHTGKISALAHRTLQRPSVNELAPVLDQPSQGIQQIGIARSAGPAGQALALTQELDWERLGDGGQAGVLTLSSTGATALRIGLLVNRLPASAEIRFFNADQSEVHAVSGSEILDQIAVNIRAGDASDQARTYWSPVVEGDFVGVEIYLPAGLSDTDVDLTSSQLSHLVYSASTNTYSSELLALKNSGSCNLDVMCHSAGNDLRNAVARMIFTENGSSFLCTGTLMNSSDGQFIPYFLTANHCIDSQTLASTLNTFWFYRSSACNSGVLNAANRRLTGGAAMLWTSQRTDMSFLRLNNPAPSGAWFAGWDAATPSSSTPAVAVHHPAGDLQKISFSDVVGFANCNGGCSSATNGDYLVVVHSQGTTEPGSSGSGIFRNQQLIGALRGGGASCTNLSAPDVYGRFDLSFQDGNLGQWLLGNAPEEDFNPAYGGLWFNPAQDGHGLSVTIHSETSATVYWYTFDHDSFPMWLIGAGTINGNRIEADVFYLWGMTFGSWNTADRQLFDWGTFDITFDSCDDATFSYQSTLELDGQSFGSGSFPLKRLAFTDGLSCP